MKRTTLALSLLSTLTLVAAAIPTVAPSAVEADSSGLPYYVSADLTPLWADDTDLATEHRIADFALRSQSGQTVSSSDLDGKLYVASFLFTRCGGICPRIVRNVKEIQAEFAGASDVVIVSYTVTPETDTVEVLERFGRSNGIDSASWHLLTGDRDAIYRLARRSFFADGAEGLARDSERDPNQLVHTENLILVDGERRIRGVYNGTRKMDVSRLIEDIHRLRG